MKWDKNDTQMICKEFEQDLDRDEAPIKKRIVKTQATWQSKKSIKGKAT